MARCARKTITVRADLKARMDAIKEEVNWSAVASLAFKRKVAEIAKRKGVRAMQSTIERLRESKMKSDESQFQEGFVVGQKWAKNSADAEELERLADFHASCERQSWGWEGFFDLPEGCSAFSTAERVAFRIIGEEQCPGREHASDFWQSLWQEGSPPNEFVRGFVEGALDVWDQVKDEI
jgi:hypothetical protein